MTTPVTASAAALAAALPADQAAAHRTAASIAADTVTHTPDLTLSAGGFGSRAGWTPIGPAGMSAVIAASSARVRDASAWPTLASNSSLVSRPCTNAALSALIACSRSTWDARRPRGGTAGPVVTNASSPIRHKERNPAAVGDHPAGRGRVF